ncbi:MAG TPA: hypothetical protein VK464_16300 [Symbiobacteriaceae bacterium]|nr:hypothetical protein [Symbiobacteriaceae bacterium]
MKRLLLLLFMVLLVGCTTTKPVPPAPPPTPMPGSGTTEPGPRTPPREGVGLWSPSGSYLWYDQANDAWQEIDPASNQATPFLPNNLTGQNAGNLRFSPDGRRLLFDTPDPLTTWLINTDGMDFQQVGVNVEVLWEGNEPVIASKGFYPPDTKTGEAAVDRVIDALNRRDLYSLVKFSPIACSAQTGGMGELPCPEGTPDATVLEVFPYGACEPNFLPAGDQLRRLFDYLTAQPSAIYGVYRLNPQQQGAAYGILLQRLQAPWTAVTLLVDANGNIVQEYGCGPAVNMLPLHPEYLLPPK